MAAPKKNAAYEFDIALVDTADTGAFKANPTIAAGDFKVSTDNGALANLATLPVVDPAGSIIVKINLSAAEMNGDKIMVQCIDAAGGEWDDVLIFIDATVVNVDDIVRATTPANTLDVTGGNAHSLLKAADAGIINAAAPRKNVAFSNIPFQMVDSADHVTPKAGLTVSGTRSLDAGAYVAVSGSIAEVANGMYQFDAAAADMNADILTFRFVAAGADDKFLTIKTAP